MKYNTCNRVLVYVPGWCAFFSVFLLFINYYLHRIYTIVWVCKFDSIPEKWSISEID